MFAVLVNDNTYQNLECFQYSLFVELLMIIPDYSAKHIEVVADAASFHQTEDIGHVQLLLLNQLSCKQNYLVHVLSCLGSVIFYVLLQDVLDYCLHKCFRYLLESLNY